MEDSSGFETNYYSGSITVTMTTPAPILTKSLSQSTTALNTTAVYTVTYTNINAMPSGASFLITYPSMISPSTTLSTCSVTVNNVQYSMSCTVSSNTIKVYGGLTTAVAAGSSISISLGSITNPVTEIVTPTSMSVTSYTDST